MSIFHFTKDVCSFLALFTFAVVRFGLTLKAVIQDWWRNQLKSVRPCDAEVVVMMLWYQKWKKPTPGSWKPDNPEPLTDTDLLAWGDTLYIPSRRDCGLCLCGFSICVCVYRLLLFWFTGLIVLGYGHTKLKTWCRIEERHIAGKDNTLYLPIFRCVKCR